MRDRPRREAPVTHEEARDILSRFINSHFRKQHMEGVQCARFTIPYDANRDDDSLMAQYIDECEAEIDRLRAQVAAFEQRDFERAEVFQDRAEIFQ